jgi:hypothetical protein
LYYNAKNLFKILKVDLKGIIDSNLKNKHVIEIFRDSSGFLLDEHLENMMKDINEKRINI